MEELSVPYFGVPEKLIFSQILSFQTWEDFLNVGIPLVQQRSKSAWWLGLLALGIETKWGEDSIGKYAKEIGISTSSLKVYRWVVKQYLTDNPAFQPPERLSFGVLQSIAKLPPDQREKFLEEAEDGGMSVERARVEVQKTEGKPMKPKFRVWYCEPCGKWHFQPEEPELWGPIHE